MSARFPGINFTVTAKADSKFKIVGAASVAAKVTRDAWIEGWIFEEDQVSPSSTQTEDETPRPWGNELGSGYPSGRSVPLLLLVHASYAPSDPKTQAWIRTSMDPVFGFPSLVRFSWTTIKVAMDKDAHKVKWSVTLGRPLSIS